MKKLVKQAIWFQVLLIICLRIGSRGAEDTCSNVNSPLETSETIPEFPLEIENSTGVQFEKFRPSETEDLKNESNETFASAQRRVKRIVGGHDAGPGRFPWMAGIHIKSKFKCGGSLVNRFHVVTAGHCVAHKALRKVMVTLGVYNISDMTSTPPTQKFNVSKITLHPRFQRKARKRRFDVAVIRLDRPVEYMAHISPINLPGRDESFVGQTASVAGWGDLKDGKSEPELLQAVDLPVIDNRACERWHRRNGKNVTIPDETMCAGYRGGGKDSCQGDSGGPLMVQKNDGWYLIGIVTKGYSCAKPGKPGQYHNVAKTVDWMKGEIDSYNGSPEHCIKRDDERIGCNR